MNENEKRIDESSSAASEQKKSQIPAAVSIKMISSIVAIIVIAAILFAAKGLFIAATVDGHPISRLAVVSELEKQSGQGVLDALISQQLIAAEAAKQKITVSDEEINAEVSLIEEQLKSQSTTLDVALASQGITLDYLKGQIKTQKELEKLLSDKITVTDAEIDSYIKTNKVTIPAGQETETRSQIKDQLAQQKVATEAPALLSSLRSKASINYFVKYQAAAVQ